MASIYTPDGTKVPLEILRALLIFFLARVSSDPHAAAFVAPIKALRADLNPVAAKEQALEEEIILAQALVVAGDRGLDGASGLVKTAIHKGKKVDVSLPRHKLFFGNDSPSVFEKQSLSPQLTAMGSWPDFLAKSGDPDLVALVPLVTAAIKAGQIAEKALADAVAALDVFRLGGERTRIFEKFNSLCATTYGALKALVHDHPELGLVSGYSESFFHRGPAARPATPATLDDAIAEVKALEAQLVKAMELRDGLQATATAHANQVKLAETAALQAADAQKAADEAALAAKAAQEAADELDPTPGGKSKKKKK
jgi:hypothetical protein